MSKESIQELEQIQKGLEDFLEKEVAGYREIKEDGAGTATGWGAVPPQGQFTGNMAGQGAVPPQGQFAGNMAGQGAVPPQGQFAGNMAGQGAVPPQGQFAGNPSYVQQGDGAMKKNQKTKKASKEPQRRPAVEEERKRPKKRRKKHTLLKMLLALLAVLCILAVVWRRTVDTVYEQVNYEEIETLVDEPLEEEGVTNVLLIGNDSRTQGEDGRSDAMILVSLSNETKTIHMTSLLRDMYVDIPGHGQNRLNAAYAYGGAQLLMETLEENFGISVNRYVLVNFQAFANLVDAVGGVDLELTNDEVRYINGYLVEYNMLENRPEGTDYLDESLSGNIHLNGPQALAYCRNRYLGTDFGRTERQRKVLTAIIKQAPMALVANSSKVMESLLPNLTTNLTKEECADLSLQVPKVISYDIVQGSIPIEGSYSNVTIDKKAVLQVDFEKNKEYIQQNIYGEEP